jgi:cytochrome c oxidase assembly protein subunit 11
MSGQLNSKRQSRTAAKLGLVVLGMFGFGFALVPLYNVFCEITGLNGKTGVVGAEQARAYTVDESRQVTVEFVTSLNQGLNWEFAPTVRKMIVHPGKVYSTLFVAQNLYPQEMIGQAVPSVMPSVASRYFNKTECFCFVNQSFGAGERREMPVSFVIDPSLPRDVETVTLSYTFFDVTQTAAKSIGN